MSLLVAVWIKMLPAAPWVYVDNLCVAGTCYWSIAWQLWWFGPVISALPPSSARHTLNSTKAPSSAWWTRGHWVQQLLQRTTRSRTTWGGSSKALFQHSFSTGWGLPKMGIECEIILTCSALCQACGRKLASECQLGILLLQAWVNESPPTDSARG